MEHCPGEVGYIDLEVNVVKRKRSLASIVNRRMVKSCHEIEVCCFQDQDQTEKNKSVKDVSKYCFRPTRDIQSLYYHSLTNYKRKYFYNFSTSPEMCHFNRIPSSRYNTLV